MNNDAAPAAGISRNRTGWTIAALGLLVFAGVFVFVRLTRDVQLAPPHVIGSVWSAESGGRSRVFFVTREDRAQTRAFDPEGQYTYQHTYSIYMLHAREAQSGAATAQMEIARLDTTKPDFARYRSYTTMPRGPGVLGFVGELIWLWNGGLEARNVVTLEPVWTPAKVLEVNQAEAAVLPDDPKYARVLAPLDALVVKGRDARYYRVDPASGKLEPADEARLAALSREHTKTADTAFANLDAGGRALPAATGAGAICRKAWIDDGLWCALLTAEERTQLSSRQGSLEDWDYHNWFYSMGETARTAYRGRYSVVPEPHFGRNAIELDVSTVEPVNGARLLMAGFLRRPSTNDAWTCSDVDTAASVATTGAASGAGKAELVLHRKALGEKQPWQLMRLGRNGSARWDCSTGLSELGQLCEGDGAVILTGLAASDADQPKGERPERMLFVNERTGEMAMLNVASGALEQIK